VQTAAEVREDLLDGADFQTELKLPIAVALLALQAIHLRRQRVVP
jgi:hypothetical protein